MASARAVYAQRIMRRASRSAGRLGIVRVGRMPQGGQRARDGDALQGNEPPVTYGGNVVEDFEVLGNSRSQRIPVKKPTYGREDVTAEFDPDSGSSLEERCVALLTVYIVGKNALSGEMEMPDDKTEEDELFVEAASDLARMIDTNDEGFQAPPLFYEIWTKHCDAMEGGQPWESPVVKALEDATPQLVLSELRSMARKEKIPRSYSARKEELVQALNARLRSLDDVSAEFEEDDIQELEVKVLDTVAYPRVGDGKMVSFVHVRSIASSEEAIVPKVFDFAEPLGALFQASPKYLARIAPNTKFVFVTMLGSGPDQSFVFFETKKSDDPIELRIPRRRIRDLCDAVVNGAPPLPVGDEAVDSVSETLMSNINARLADESQGFETVEVSDEYLYYPTTLTVPSSFKHKEPLVACYAFSQEASRAQEGQIFRFSCMEKAPGSAVALYESDDGVSLRILMHRIPYLLEKLGY